MALHSVLEQEIAALIRRHGRITFFEFMRSCLYSPRGGFYANRRERIGAHFGTAPASHPVFGALIARQLEQMWHLLGDPAVFHLIEVGAGDGSLARSIAHACEREAPDLSRCLYYVAADYQPHFTELGDGRIDWQFARSDSTGAVQDPKVQRVQAEGLRPFRNLTGCVLSNELLDNFPVHRFVILDGTVKEVFVTLDADRFVEIIDEPSTVQIAERLASLGLSLPEGFRGEVSVALAAWSREIARALDRGFVLTIDYGDEAARLYSPEREQGTIVCFHRHAVRADPYQDVGEQDITCHVDFTSLMRCGERDGLATIGYTRQREFLMNLGFSSYLDALDAQGLSAARSTLSKMAMMALVDPGEYGDFKVLAQAKGVPAGDALLGFSNRAPLP
jgi:SAM-dependent MidA family methyltransferase